VGTKHEGAGNKTLGTSQSIEINGNGDVLMNYLRTNVRVSNQLALTSRLPRPLYHLPPPKWGLLSGSQYWHFVTGVLINGK